MKNSPDAQPHLSATVAPPHPRDWTGVICASLVIALAVANLGWWWGIVTQRMTVGALAPSAPSTAASFLLVGIALGIRALWPWEKWSRRIALALGGAVAAAVAH